MPHLIDKLEKLQNWSGKTLLSDEVRKSRHLDYIWPRLNTATLGLDSGVFLIPGPANLGKSALVLNMYLNIIAANPDAFVIDFSLDDSREDRFRNSVARIAKLPINWIRLPHLIPEDEREGAQAARRAAARKWRDEMSPRLQIIDETGLDNSARKFSVIRQVITEYREQLPEDMKLVVVVDGFHNITVDEMQHSDDVPKQNFLSTEMKNLASNTKSVIIATAQTPKKSLRRGLDQDSVKGAGGATYDAKIIAPIFSDFAVNRGNAEIVHSAVVPDGPRVPVQLPVIELDIAKNKAGSYKDIIFCKFYPYCAYVEEAEESLQSAWRKTVYGVSPS